MSNKTTKFHPILFSTPMVQAIMNGTKTQTRRTKGLQDSYPLSTIFEESNSFPKQGNWIAKYKIGSNPDRFEIENVIKCPYEVGDVLWVKETTKVGAWNDENYEVAFDYKASPELKKTPWSEFEDTDKFMALQSKLLAILDKLGIKPTIDKEKETFCYKWEPGESPFKWTPSIFMPKEACRTFLKVKSIRVERLQDISEEDAQAEGAHFLYHGLGTVIIDSHPDWKKLYKPHASYKDGFHYIWKYINGEDSWQFNPYVFVYEFEKIEKPLDFIV